MRRGTGSLAARIAKLEADARRARRRWPCMAFSIYDHDAAVTGFSGPSGAICERKAGEGMEALTRRSAVAFGHPVGIFAIYDPAAMTDDEPRPAEATQIDLGECDPWETPAPEPAIFDRSQHWSEFRKSQEW